MALQIFGTKKCQNTRKAEMFFKERRIPYHFVDLNEKPMSRGEFDKVKQAAKLENMIDREGKEFKKLNLQFMAFDLDDTLYSNQALLKTPIVRDGAKATAGYAPDTWKTWLEK